jgi:hypothetical protein
MSAAIARRKFLRGSLGGAAISVGLPLLDCFLNDNGTALASGAPLPVRFGTWFWGLGHTPGRAVTSTLGMDYAFLENCAALRPYKSQINYFSNFSTPTDGKPNIPHDTGHFAHLVGNCPSAYGDIPSPTIDVLISDEIGSTTRFRSLELTASGNARDSFSARSTGDINAAETTPIGFYTRLFGDGFVDPNKADFKPAPRVMVRQSVLSAVSDDATRFGTRVGSADKARLDEYFTSIRQLEQQLSLQLQKPPPAAACVVSAAPAADIPIGSEIGVAMNVHRMMSQLVALAVACDQSRVFNMAFSASASQFRRAGESATNHTLTHEEPVDATLGYQPISDWFATRSMEGMADFVAPFAAIREGDGTLLDNTLIFAHTDTNYARLHQLDGIPMMTVGKAGGRMKSGLHVGGNADPVTRVGLTLMQIMGLSIDQWGTRSLRTSKAIGEIMA